MHLFLDNSKTVLIQMRVWQWTKNVLVFGPIIFGGQLFNMSMLVNTILVFFAVSFAASTAYTVNDLFDIDSDRLHPIKKHRPLASGRISKKSAYALVIALFILTSCASIWVSIPVFFLAMLYLALNLLYSKKLKHMAITDILIVAFFYIYRVFIGGFAIGLHVSGWLILTTLFIALFMIVGKRRSEMNREGKTRSVLDLYNKEFLNAGLIISVTLFVVFYSLYAVLVQSEQFLITIFPVIFIALRYLYLIFVNNLGEEPEKLIFKDKELLIASVVLGLLMVGILYYKMLSF